MSGSNPQLCKICSRDLRDFFLPLCHCFTISIGTLYSPLMFGVKTRRRREATACSLTLTTPGTGSGCDLSFNSGIADSLRQGVMTGLSTWAELEVQGPLTDMKVLEKNRLGKGTLIVLGITTLKHSSSNKNVKPEGSKTGLHGEW